MPFPDHVEWIAQHMGDALEQELKRQSAPVSARSALSTLCEADPSPDKVAVQWLAERLLDGGFLWEDVRSGIGSKVHETLVTFETHKRVLAARERRLETHSTLASVWAAVAHLIPRQDGLNDEPGIRERRRMEKAVARDESIILHERPGLIVAVPLTEQAAKWWGRGTRWCTAADRDNAFETYDAHGPLIVVVLPDDKLQLFMDSRGSSQFCDAMDKVVPVECIERHWDDIGPLILWATSRSPRMARYVPSGLCDLDMLRRAVADDAGFLEKVPLGMRDREMCLGAVKKMADTLRLVPESLLDREICLAAVTRSGMFLEHVPETLRDQGVCLESVSQNGMALEHVPERMRDREMCLVAVECDGNALEYVPEHVRDREMCLKVVSRCGNALPYVPEWMRDREMYLVAVGSSRESGWLWRKGGLWQVPEGMRDRDLCLAAVKHYGFALTHVPEQFRDREMCMAATNDNPGAIRHVPAALRNRDMCLNAVSKNGDDLKHVPMPLRDREMCIAAVISDAGGLQHIPAQVRDRDMVLAAARSGRFSLLKLQKDNCLDREMCLAAVGASGFNLAYVPETLLDREMCLIAVREDNDAIRWVPKPLRAEILAMVQTRERPARSWSHEVALEGLKEALVAGNIGRTADVQTTVDMLPAAIRKL